MWNFYTSGTVHFEFSHPGDCVLECVCWEIWDVKLLIVNYFLMLTRKEHCLHMIKMSNKHMLPQHLSNRCTVQLSNILD